MSFTSMTSAYSWRFSVNMCILNCCYFYWIQFSYERLNKIKISRTMNLGLLKDDCGSSLSCWFSDYPQWDAVSCQSTLLLQPKKLIPTTTLAVGVSFQFPMPVESILWVNTYATTALTALLAKLPWLNTLGSLQYWLNVRRVDNSLHQQLLQSSSRSGPCWLRLPSETSLRFPFFFNCIGIKDNFSFVYLSFSWFMRGKGKDGA